MSLTTPPADGLTADGCAFPAGNAHPRPRQPLPVASRREMFLRLLNRRWRLRVRGHSMLPGIAPGDELFFDPFAYKRASPQVGDVVMARHPRRDEWLLKRITLITSDGRLFLQGDNPEESTDSRTLGLFELEAIRGRVTSRFPAR